MFKINFFTTEHHADWEHWVDKAEFFVAQGAVTQQEEGVNVRFSLGIFPSPGLFPQEIILSAEKSAKGPPKSQKQPADGATAQSKGSLEL